MSKNVKIILTISIVLNLAIFYVGYKALEYRAHINHFLEKYQKVSEEFSARSVYSNENKAVSADSTITDRIIFFGTQVTYKYDLKKHFPEYDAINRGVEGQRVNGYLLRFKPDVLDLSPEAVIIEISSYNFRDYNTIEEIQDYTELFCQLARFNHIEPFLTTVITPRKQLQDLEDEKEFGDYNVFDSVKTYNNWLQQYSRTYSIPLVDVDMLLADKEGYLSEELSGNLVEPNEKGYEIITEALKKELKKSKEKKEAGIK